MVARQIVYTSSRLDGLSLDEVLVACGLIRRRGNRLECPYVLHLLLETRGAPGTVGLAPVHEDPSAVWWKAYCGPLAVRARFLKTITCLQSSRSPQTHLELAPGLKMRSLSKQLQLRTMRGLNMR